VGRKNRRKEIHIRPLPTVEKLNPIKPKRMEIWYAELEKERNSFVQSGERPVLIVSNDINNRNAPTVNVIPITSSVKKLGMPTHRIIHTGNGRTSMILAEQITTLDKRHLIRRLGMCENKEAVEEAVRVQLFGGE